MATREMIDVMKKLKDLGYYDQVDEGKKAKPDYIDIDGDGNKKEPMKKAVKDKEKKKTNEAKACNCNEDCACGGNCGPNCNCGPDCGKSVKESVNEAITITADSPDDLPALQRIMKLAGMEPVGQDMMPQGDTPDMTMKGDDNINGNCGCEDEAEGYANEPDAQYSTTNDITRLAGLNGLNGSKNPKDLRVKDPAYHEDEQTEEGYANSMGKEKEEETYSVDSLEKQYGKTEIKKLPRKFSMRGDNPLEDIEEALRQDYITFVNESADVKKKTNHSQINEGFFLPALVWAFRIGSAAASIYGTYAMINKLIQIYEDGNGDWSVYIQALPWTEETSSAECGAYYNENGYMKPGWCNLTSDSGSGPDQAAAPMIRNLYIDIALMFGGAGVFKLSGMAIKKIKANKQAADELAETGKKLVEELSKQNKVPMIQNIDELKKVNASVLKGIAAIKNADLAIDVQGGMRVITNLKTGEKIFLDPNNAKVANLLKRLQKFDGDTDITAAFNTLKKYSDPNVTSGGIIKSTK